MRNEHHFSRNFVGEAQLFKIRTVAPILQELRGEDRLFRLSAHSANAKVAQILEELRGEALLLK